MTGRPMSEEEMRRVLSKADRLTARLWRVLLAELRCRPQSGALTPGGAGDAFAVLDPERLTAAALALGAVTGRIVAGASPAKADQANIFGGAKPSSQREEDSDAGE